jgi:23S rRNA pseudouridine955/2504/2580 synthase
MTEHIITNLESPTRIDKYIKMIMPSISHGIIEKSIRLGNIKIGKLKVKSSCERVQNNFSLQLPNFFYSKYQDHNREYNSAQSIDIKLLNKIKKQIIFEDDNIIVLNKPMGIACQGGTNILHSIDKLMNEIYNTKIRIVHRLDKNTSGLMILAKNLKYAQILTQLFRENKIKKTYHAICEYILHPAEYMTQKYTKQILQMETITLKTHLKTSKIGDEEKIFIDHSMPNNSESQITLLEKIKDDLFLIEVKPETGKKHQIRVHLQHICFPILGDHKYNYNKSQNKLFLNSSEVEIPDLKLKFSCNLPYYFYQYLNGTLEMPPKIN